MNNIADDISHAYQDGFNDGVRSVLSKTGFFLVKDGKVYAVDMPYDFKYQKSVDLMTGEIHYPTNRMRLRGMTDKELADWLSIYCCRNKTYDAHCETFGSCEACWLAWLNEEVTE